MRILTAAQEARLTDPRLAGSRVVGWNEDLQGPIVRKSSGLAHTLTTRGHLARNRRHDHFESTWHLEN